MKAAQAIDRANGVTIAYAMGLINALLATLLAFGVHISQDQRGAVTAFVNAALVLVAHVAHAQAKRAHQQPTPTTEGEG